MPKQQETELRSKRHSRRTMSAALGSVALIAAIVTGIWPASAFSTSIHERITRNALPFMTSTVLGTIVAGNHDEDERPESDLAERHAQNCRFRDSADYANMRYGQVVDALREPQANDPNRAARLFGHILHGVQDFYSHSNWIPRRRKGWAFAAGCWIRGWDCGAGRRPIRSCSTTSLSSKAILRTASAYACPPMLTAASHLRCRSSLTGVSSLHPSPIVSSRGQQPIRPYPSPMAGGFEV
jgi:hypothetical protein